MTTLFRPVLIESAEQAEALPPGTIALDRPRGGGIPEASVKSADGSWTGTLDGGRPYGALQMVGDYALVPIEAEEETTERPRLCQPVPDVLHRYTTPWTIYTSQEPQ